MIKSLLLENFRCFGGWNEIPIAPLTLLVGENSAGKTTLLAGAKLAQEALLSPEFIDLNERPFFLGTFDDIVCRTKQAKPKTMSLGYSISLATRDGHAVSHSLKEPAYVSAKYSGAQGEPRLEQWRISSGKYAVTIQRDSQRFDRNVAEVTIGEQKISIPPESVPPYIPSSVHYLAQFLRFMSERDGHRQPMLPGFELAKPLRRDDLLNLEALAYALDDPQIDQPVLASAPVRSTPKRTYDPLTEQRDPAGEHVSVLLSRHWPNHQSSDWSHVAIPLLQYARQSGLFTDLEVERLGSQENAPTNPFRIKVRWDGGPSFNLMDVGFGVGQVLPVVVDTLSAFGGMLLLQQPEVHLHPRAQAELGSFFARQAGTDRSPMIIETHSDYLVDRVRMEVRAGEFVGPEHVLILYFEKNESGISVHPIRLDSHGNLVGAPSGYRRFFMEEERRIMGLE
ncbi:MAG: AAA family ATPase [Phycisphaerales bacterium]